MGRPLGSPNQENRWTFLMYDPFKLKSEKVVLFHKEYKSINSMYEDLKGSFTKPQLSAYAAQTRNPPNFVEITRIVPKE